MAGACTAAPGQTELATANTEEDGATQRNTKGILLFAGVVGAVAANMLTARRYMQRICASIPEEMPYVRRSAMDKYWTAESSKARWDSYYAAEEHEKRRRMERLYQWMMQERERQAWQQRMGRFHQQRMDPWASFHEAFKQQQRQRQQQRQQQYERQSTRQVVDMFDAWRWRQAKAVLGIEEIPDDELTASHVKHAFWDCSLKYHPDRMPPEERGRSSKRFLEVSQAKSFLLEQLGERQQDKRRPVYDDDDDL